MSPVHSVQTMSDDELRKNFAKAQDHIRDVHSVDSDHEDFNKFLNMHPFYRDVVDEYNKRNLGETLKPGDVVKISSVNLVNPDPNVSEPQDRDLEFERAHPGSFNRGMEVHKPSQGKQVSTGQISAAEPPKPEASNEKKPLTFTEPDLQHECQLTTKEVEEGKKNLAPTEIPESVGSEVSEPVGQVSTAEVHQEENDGVQEKTEDLGPGDTA